MQIVMGWLGILRRLGQELGPYLVVELVLPGGTLLALLLFLYRRRRAGIGSVAPRIGLAVPRALARMVEQGIFARRPCYLRPSQAFDPGAGDRP